jgi:hypothetical protein
VSFSGISLQRSYLYAPIYARLLAETMLLPIITS